MQTHLSDIFEHVNVNDLNNLEHMHLHKQDLNICQNSGVPELMVFVPHYTGLIIALDEAIAKQKRSSKTEVLVVKDRYRDDMVQGVRLKINIGQYHWNPEVRAAAKRADAIYDTYQKDLAKNYRKESEAIINLLQAFGDSSSNLSMPTGTPGMGGTGGSMGGGTTGGGTAGGSVMPGTYSADVTTLELNEWLDHLKAANNDFMATYTSREADRVEAELLKEIKEARKACDNYLRMMLNTIAMLIETNGMAQYENLVAQLNVVFHEWNVTLNVRKGKAKAAKEKENNGENTNTTPENGEENQGGENNGENQGGENPDNNSGEDNTPSANA